MRIGRGKDTQQEVIYGITDAPTPLSQDIRSRESKYLMAMGIRVAAFVLIVVLPIAWPWKLGLAALALLLPYVAVVYANGGREPERGADSWYQEAGRQALTPGRSAQPGPEQRADGKSQAAAEPLVGLIVTDETDDESE